MVDREALSGSAEAGADDAYGRRSGLFWVRSIGRRDTFVFVFMLFMVAGLAERSGKAIYNTSILIGPQGLIGLYRKAHLFKDEPKWFAPGNTPFEAYDIGPARIGMMICFDWAFPEAARVLALQGATIMPSVRNVPLATGAVRSSSG